jgi:hypothetical protein
MKETDEESNSSNEDQGEKTIDDKDTSGITHKSMEI